ncbi:twin-arginine translocase subunit TatB [Rhodovulum sulfidophilum]|uniref:Sec-independent protein translocase protein TatB n=1 Tax=Rhodovulum sulfidophilum TaxID=35806 RepID=UPI0019249D70|nr:Sec-independent protein translocase protein TatB [Rhodovulum sulfidophilum]MBL3574671.1 twin-arginine translocase subunit TatB [Rhodovulum sulfidophilum]MBL3586697.1 twin-arginine translocase subunit TatB [Rhodovulum sulfidophilum]MCE8431682.1 Sec-independent protein translocase protein TatB [Rhodovulum sulfidophilum]MCF4116195.1 Sec-independent protein translocase protein TatB [Rhodovulum sulfidophilum]
MFDIGWTELLLIGIVALIVVGPKDLPGMFRTLGRFTAKARNMAREFQRAMDDAADQSGVRETVDDLKDIADPRKLGLDRLNEAADRFEKWEPKLPKPGESASPATDARAAKAEKIRRAMAETGAAKRAAPEAAEGDVPAPEDIPAKTPDRTSDA